MICSISNIRLTNALLFQLGSSKYATLLLYNWLSFVGPFDFQGHLLSENIRTEVYRQLNLRMDFTVEEKEIPKTESKPSSNIYEPESETESETDVYTPDQYEDPDHLRTIKRKFLSNEFDNLMQMFAQNEEAFDTSPVLYLKILIGFALQYDAIFTVNQLIIFRNVLDVLVSDFSALDFSTNIDRILDRIADGQDTIQVTLTTLMKENSYDSVITMVNMIGKAPTNISVLATLALIG